MRELSVPAGVQRGELRPQVHGHTNRRDRIDETVPADRVTLFPGVWKNPPVRFDGVVLGFDDLDLSVLASPRVSHSCVE